MDLNLSEIDQYVSKHAKKSEIDIRVVTPKRNPNVHKHKVDQLFFTNVFQEGENEEATYHSNTERKKEKLKKNS